MLLPIKDLAKILAVSPRHVFALERAGKLPEAIRLGRSKRWDSDEITAWVRAGCPSRDQWDRSKKMVGTA